jgi:hypothetical protein
MQYLSKREAGEVREVKAVVVENFLDSLVKEHGNFTIEQALQKASSPKEKIHKYFIWDNEEAGNRYRLIEMRAMVSATRYIAYLKDNGKRKVINIAEARTVRKFLPKHRGEGFATRQEVLGDDSARQELIERKNSALRSWCDSVVDIEELQPLRDIILRALEGNLIARQA